MERILNILNDFKRLPALRKFSAGMMMGVAIAWVLLRRESAEPNAPVALVNPTPPEIDITEPHLPLEEETTPENLPAPQADDFTLLHGIGPVFARRLHQSGIFTFAQLAQTPAETLRTIVQAKNWQKIDPEAWRTQAQTHIA